MMVTVQPSHKNCSKPQKLQQTVLATKADVGIALDGDGDRVIMVDHRGEIVDGDELLYIIACDRHKSKHWQGGVVGTLMSNLGLEIALKNMGLDFVRTAVGDRYVLSELESKDWLLGGEQSGHIICRYATTTGDGIISALQVLAAMTRNNSALSDLKRGMTKFPQTMINVKLHTIDTSVLQHPQLQQAVTAAEAQLGKFGRILIRSSGTEPVIRVMLEGQEKTMVDSLARELADIVIQVVARKNPY
jgi:phosphoglucosamine mutase